MASSDLNSTLAKKGKKLIPWRDPEKGPLLKAAMFKLAFTSDDETNKIYYKAPGETSSKDQRWQDFTAELFDQPEFFGLEGSFRSIRDMFQNTMDERAKHHGWMDANGGITGNLSNHTGDLSDLDSAPKNVLFRGKS